MGNNKTITLIDGYREVGEVELVCAFKIPDYNGKYIIYTKNEKDRDGNTIIYSGKIITIDKINGTSLRINNLFFNIVMHLLNLFSFL